MPETIVYNLKSRGRSHTGQPRNYNIRALVDSINGPECQERVKARDMQGYLGHWPRILFGMDGAEGGVVQGKVVNLEPAIVTTSLKAYDDGRVEHATEFLDTEPGQKAKRMFDASVGGFSSAIDEGKMHFAGFDYVKSPNFLGNSFRGKAALDDASQQFDVLTVDDIAAANAEEQEEIAKLMALFDSVAAAKISIDAAAATIKRLQEDNEHYLSMLATRGTDAKAALDAAAGIKPVTTDAATRMANDIKEFRAALLPSVAAPVTGDDKKAVAVYENVLQRLRR